MFPQVSSVFFNWMSAVQMRVVKKEPVDFEMVPDVLAVVTFDAVLQAMKSKEVNRKPEGLRSWKWWDLWTTTNLPVDTVVQDPDGTQFRIQSTDDWSQGGFYHYEATEQPNALP